jgi:hypothetical protein
MMSEADWSGACSQLDVQTAIERIREAYRARPKFQPVERILMLSSLYQKMKEYVQRFEESPQSLAIDVCQYVYGIPCERFDSWNDLMNRKITLEAFGVKTLILVDEIKEAGQ